LRAAAKLPDLVQRALTVAVAGSALIWGIWVLPRSEAADDFRALEGQLLRFETFSQTTLTQEFEDQASHGLDRCDTHAERAMLLMEMPLAASALRSGAAAGFDRRIQSMEARSRQALSCAPRDSFIWLLTFDLAVLRGLSNEHSFGQLAMSYDTSPNEAWIAIRRIVIAVPLLLVAPDPVRQSILREFQLLIRNGFARDAARAYLAAAEPVRALLQARVEQLDPAGQKAFSDALRAPRP